MQGVKPPRNMIRAYRTDVETQRQAQMEADKKKMTVSSFVYLALTKYLNELKNETND
jgi:hypothetical protein